MRFKFLYFITSEDRHMIRPSITKIFIIADPHAVLNQCINVINVNHIKSQSLRILSNRAVRACITLPPSHTIVGVVEAVVLEA